MPQKGRGIFMVYVDIDAKDVQEFNEWYNKEHLPELLSVPGILSAARYEAVKGGPQYLACYELESVAVMQTPAFTNRPRTPWGQKVSPSVIGKNLTRIVGEQIYPDGIEMPERGMAPVLQIGRMSVPADLGGDGHTANLQHRRHATLRHFYTVRVNLFPDNACQILPNHGRRDFLSPRRPRPASKRRRLHHRHAFQFIACQVLRATLDCLVAGR